MTYERGYAKLEWTVEDVQEVFPGWEHDRALEFLQRNENRLRDRLIELGYDVIRNLGKEEPAE